MRPTKPNPLRKPVSRYRDTLLGPEVRHCRVDWRISSMQWWTGCSRCWPITPAL